MTQYFYSSYTNSTKDKRHQCVCVCVTPRPQVKFADVAGLDQAKAAAWHEEFAMENKK